MKWFSHPSDASRGKALKKLLIKYGAEGYGVYWYCMENICANVDPKLTFELDLDVEILAHELKIDSVKVNNVMLYMVELGLFENAQGTVSCIQMAAMFGSNLTRNSELKGIIREQKTIANPPLLSQTVSDSLGQSQIVSATGQDRIGEDRKHIDQNHVIKRKSFQPPTVDQVQEYLDDRGITTFTGQTFVDHYQSNGWMRGKTKIKDWKACVRTWHGNHPEPEIEREDIL